MKNKQNHFLIASFALLIFVMIGYTVKFFPESLTSLDSSIQTAIRGTLPQSVTRFFRIITVFGNVTTQLLVVTVSVIAFLFIKWKMEAFLVLSNGFVAALLISSFKLLYQRPRPSIEHLYLCWWFLFPKWSCYGEYVDFRKSVNCLPSAHQIKTTTSSSRCFVCDPDLIDRPVSCLFGCPLSKRCLSRIYFRVWDSSFPLSLL